MINWRDITALTDSTVLGMFSERFQFTPYASSPNGHPKPDSSRSILELSAVLYFPDEKTIITPGAGFDAKAEASPARIAINRADYPDLTIRRGDVLQALDRQGQPILKVGKVTADQRSVIVAEVAQ